VKINKVLLALAAVMILGIVSCKDATPPSPPVNPVSNVTPVTPIDPSQLASVSTTDDNPPSSAADTVVLFTGLSANPANASILSDLDSLFVGSSALSTKSIVAKALNTSISQLEADIENQVTNFPNTKTFNTQLVLSNQALGSYFVVNSINASIKQGITTTDNGPLLIDYSNLNTGSGTGTVSVNISSANLPANSDIKDIRLVLNVGVQESFTTSPGDSTRLFSGLTYDYGISLAGAITIDNSVTHTGGKILISGFAKNSGNVTPAQIQSPDISDFLATLLQSMTITIKAVKNDGTVTFAKTYTNVHDIIADL